MNQLNLIGIRVDDRDDHAICVQKILTEYGEKIIGRFGVPAPDENDGLIAVVMKANANEVKDFSSDLRKIDGVAVNSMQV